MINILGHAATEIKVEAGGSFLSILGNPPFPCQGWWLRLKKIDFPTKSIIFIFLLLWGFLASEFEDCQHGKSVVWWLGSEHMN